MTGTMTTRHSDNFLCFISANTQLVLQVCCSELEFVIICKTILTCIVRRVDIDALHLPSVAFHQMVQGVQVVAADVDVLAVLVLWHTVMLHIRANHCRGIQRRQHTGITLTQEVVASAFASHIHLGLNSLTELFKVEFSVTIEALREIFPQTFHFSADRRYFPILFGNCSYHSMYYSKCLISDDFCNSVAKLRKNEGRTK